VGDHFVKKLLILLCLAPSLALAGTAFDGTWKTKPDTVRVSGPPDAYEISQGMYRCTSCVPNIMVKADGMDQKVSGHDYYDSIAIKVVSDHAIETTRKMGGKIMGTDKASVSADGKTLSEEWVDYSGAKPAKGSGASKRLSAGPAGSHAISGKWQPDQFGAGSDSLVTVKYESTDNGLKMEWNGQTYDAKFDGKEYPIKSDPANTMVSLKRIDANTIEETDHRSGKVTDIVRTVASADGKSLSVEDADQIHHTKMTYTMTKQP
jgi:hypothetical protein